MEFVPPRLRIAKNSPEPPPALIKDQSGKKGVCKKMGMRTFLTSARRLLHVAQKPDWDELKLLVKISLLGIGIVGGIGFVIRVLFWVVGLYRLPTSQAPTGA